MEWEWPYFTQLTAVIFIRKSFPNLQDSPEMYGSQEELAKAGIEALDDFVREIGLPTSLRQLGVENEQQLKEIAASCRFFSGNNGKMAEGEILNIFRNCF